MNLRASAAALSLGVLAACTSFGGGPTVADRAALSRAVTPAAEEPAAKLLFDDEFGGSKLDENKWNTCYFWAHDDKGCTNGGNEELEWYLPANVSVHDGVLDLVAKKQQVDPKHPYTSGMVSTNDCCGRPVTFEFEYGYLELRAKLPPGKGMWPAFWMVPANDTWPPEIDIMEWQGSKPKTNFLTIHWRDSKGHLQQSGGAFVGPDLSKAFHTFGLSWERNSVVWYQDGRPVRTYSDPRHIPHKAMIAIVNLAIGGWLGFPNDKTRFPAHMLVDYVRVWNAYPY